MISFKKPEDLLDLPPEDPAFPLVKELIDDLITAYTWEDQPYNPDWYGYTILIEEGDADRTLDELWDGCNPPCIFAAITTLSVFDCTSSR